MKKYNILFLLILLFTFFVSAPPVKALDYYLENKFAGKSSTSSFFWLDRKATLSGNIYFKTPVSSKTDYLALSYCATQETSVYVLGGTSLSQDAIKIDTKQYCKAGDYAGTLFIAYFSVREWFYTEDGSHAYIDDGVGYYYNSSNYADVILPFGFQTATTIDVSTAILAYLQSQEKQIDYSSALSQIQQNQKDYKEEIGIVQDKLNETNTSINEMKDALTSSDTNNSQNQANSFFEGFDTNDYGLSDIVTMPLELIRGLTSNSCVALSLTLPFVNKTFELPCMSSIYQEYFGGFYNLYQLITFGFISYWVIVRIFNLVKDFKNPDHDEIEVLDL